MISGAIRIIRITQVEALSMILFFRVNLNDRFDLIIFKHTLSTAHHRDIIRS